MARVNNYQIQAAQAKERFLSYDQQKLIEKLGLQADGEYLYPILLGQRYRIHRKTGDFSRWDGENWADANTFEEVMTILDLVCDSKENRFLTGRWKNLQSFGLQFHQNLVEDTKNPLAEAIQAQPERFRAACERLGGKKIDSADIAYSFEVFDGLPMGIFFWEGDDEFAPRLRYFWDENALMYIRYETMYYAVNLLEQMISTRM